MNKWKYLIRQPTKHNIPHDLRGDDRLTQKHCFEQ